MADLDQHIQYGVSYPLGELEKYLVEPPNMDDWKWTQHEFERLSSYLWVLTEHIDKLTKDVKALQHP